MSGLFERLSAARRAEADFLMAARGPSGGWTGELSPGAVAAATGAFALHRLGGAARLSEVLSILGWLKATALECGGWGDTPSSPANPSATLLSMCALHPFRDTGEFSGCYRRARAFMEGVCDFSSPESVAASVLGIYGSDLTFSAPILAACASSGLLGADAPWRFVPRLPFELAALPQGLFSAARLPVVSYAIPALVAVGLAKAANSGPFGRAEFRLLSDFLVSKISRMQPSSGGFLEAVPLTAFCGICLAEAGLGKCGLCARGEEFILRMLRPDGSLPIDWNLSGWLTSLSASALGELLDGGARAELCGLLKSRQLRAPHPFTSAEPGGWAWIPTDGGVPDADDTCAALCAIAGLSDGLCPEAEAGVEWLLGLQNRDGGIPTFCRGWNSLPFDRSCPDISAHALKALHSWIPRLRGGLRARAEAASGRIAGYLEKSQSPEGSWTSLWFGDQDCPGGVAPVLGTAIALDHAGGLPYCRGAFERGAGYLERAQNPDGGWGGAPGAPSKNLITARAVSALSRVGGRRRAALAGAEALLRFPPQKSEPIGLYFSKLWYSEKLYAPILRLNAFSDALKLFGKNEA